MTAALPIKGTHPCSIWMLSYMFEFDVKELLLYNSTLSPAALEIISNGDPFL